jgi:hypothetical protein
MKGAKSISELVEREILHITDARIAQRIRELLVSPYPVGRSWDYGTPDEQFICWTVLEHPQSNTGIAFCSEGFGPSYPWGIVFLSGPHMNIGMDSQWYVSLEEAMRGSMAWDGPNPEGFESQ